MHSFYPYRRDSGSLVVMVFAANAEGGGAIPGPGAGGLGLFSSVYDICFGLSNEYIVIQC